MTVIERDFGKKARETVRHFGELLCLDALHEANIRANPVPYLERASERIFQLERALFEAAKAVAAPKDEYRTVEFVQVDKAEYESLLRCREIVEKALAKYARHEEF